MKAKKVNEIINESSYNDISKEDIITPEFIKDQLDKEYSTTSFILQYLNEERIDLPEEFDYQDEEDINSIRDTDDFKGWLEYELEYRLDNFKDIMNNLIDDNNEIILYREMTVAKNYLDIILTDKIKRIGEYWAFEEEKAEAHWGHNGTDYSSVIFEIKINEEYIDWIETFKLNLEHENSNDESEIRLFKNTPIKIENLTFEGNPIDDNLLNKIKLKTFKS